MSLKETLEDKIQKTEQKLFQLSLHLKRLDEDYQHLLEEMALTPEQLKRYIENAENFTPSVWEQLQNEKKMLDEKLKLELAGVPDPIKTSATNTERAHIQKHWLFVR